MKQHALIVEGRIAEIIPDTLDLDGRSISLEERYHPEFLSLLVPYDLENPPVVRGPEPQLIPSSVTMRQARLALLTAGKLAVVTAALDSLTGDAGEAARIEWEFGATVDRASPMVALLSQLVGLNDAALDQLFTDASTR